MPFLLLQTPHLVSKLPLCFAEQEMGRSSFALWNGTETPHVRNRIRNDGAL